MNPTVGSLFAGIGGIDLGFERAGFITSWQVEIDPWARKVLAKNFPKAERYGDIRDCGRHNLTPVDVVVGGFPCQDISNAGLRAGIEGERSGLWTEMHRIIGELRPRFVLVENVAALLGRGLGRVLGDLSEIGYDAEWEVVSAADVGAPHLRERVWVLAYPQCERLQTGGFSRDSRNAEVRIRGQREELLQAVEITGCGAGDVAHTGRAGIHERWGAASLSANDGPGRSERDGLSSRSVQEGTQLADADDDDAQGKFAGRADASEWRATAELSTNSDSEGLSLTRHTGGISEAPGGIESRSTLDGDSWWAIEPNVGRVAHGIPKRVDRLRGLGNAVVPQIPELYARRIRDLLAADQQRIPPHSVPAIQSARSA